MVMTPRLGMRHGQPLVMTTKLQQSIRLVQLNDIEFSAFIDGELEKIRCSSTRAARFRKANRPKRATAKRVEFVLSILHGFDPPGVFARDFGECLAIQLRDVGRFDPAMHIPSSHRRRREFAKAARGL